VSVYWSIRQKQRQEPCAVGPANLFFAKPDVQVRIVTVMR